ncbi:hypothetical protein KR026_010848 [Drosophila bipectinata]|nr:hypothetical protein KR026_010848 [Drosophila bipectinata]
MAPNWLTNQYFQPWLQKYYKDEGLKVLKIWAKPVGGKGENFFGVVTRIYVDYQQGDGVTKNQSYILKQALSPVEYGLYQREMNMYEFILPKLNEILQEAGLNEKLTPDAVVVDRERNTIILEDLVPLKYINHKDRVNLLGMHHAKVTVEMLARFHAAGVVLNQRHPELLSKYFSSRDKKAFTEVYTGLYRAFMRFINTQPELKKAYGVKLEKLGPHIVEYGARINDVTAQDLQTLIHGQCWITNMMYQYDHEGTPIHVVGFDFQLSNITSPAIDLHYFFTTSLKDEVKEEEAELVEFHYTALKENLQKLAYKGSFPSLQEYKAEFERRRFKSK